ncbi:MAG: choice-of-anchor D domain-containing protein [Ignavibacteriae bacterium]|nr:choice-of-anchor D domain-containing protein [Ignavibacteriota bacterium]
MFKRYSIIKEMALVVAISLFALSNAYSQWTKLDAPTPLVTYNALASQVYLDGTLYMFGGAPGLSQATNGAWSLDTKTPGAQWKTLASMPKPRMDGYAAAVNGKIYIVGGDYINGNTRITTPEVLEYDPAADTYTVKATMKTATYGMSGAVVDNKIYVIGGIAANAFSNITQVYDPSTNTWSNSTACTLASIYSTATAIGNDIYLIGGIYSNSGINSASASVLKGTVSGATITWKKLADFPLGVYSAASGSANGNLFVAGGANGNNVTISSMYKYDIANGKWSSSFTMPVATYHVHNMVGDGTSLYYIHGSDNPDTYKFVDGAPVPIINLNSLSLDYKLKTGTNGSKTLVVRNLGTLELDVTISVPSTDKWLTSESGEIIVDPGASFDVVMNVNPASMTEGTYTSSITLTSNDLPHKTIIVPVKMSLVDIVAKRLPLLEVFTSSTCGPCKPGNENLNNVITPIDRSNYTVLKFQQDFPGTGDPYATNETINRRDFYSINSIPRMEVDGGWDGNASSFTKPVLDAATSQTCFLNWKANYTVTGNTVNVTAILDPLVDINEPNMKIYVAVMEKLTVKNKASNGETQFEDVVKKMLPNENGSDLDPMYKGVKVAKRFEYTFPGTYRLPANGQAANRIKLASENTVEDMTNLEVVVWAQNSVTHEVYNSGWAVEGPAEKMPTLTSVSTVKFDKILNGKTKELPVEISNTGDADLTITKIEIDGDNVFTKQAISLPIVLHPGDKQSLSVTFSPNAVKVYSGTLKMYSNNNNQTDIPTTIVLSGEGSAPAGVFTPSEEAKTILSLRTAPNPTTDKSTLSYTVGGTVSQIVEIYMVNSLGQRVLELGSQQCAPGNYTVAINPANISSGSYRIIVHTSEESVQLPFVINR